jgi:hypothetical protein
MHIRVFLDPALARRWMLVSIDRLRAEGHMVTLVPADAGRKQDAILECLEWLERSLYCDEGGGWSRVDGPLTFDREEPDDAELTIDLSGNDVLASGAQLTVRYDGCASDTAVIDALLDERPCTIEVIDAANRVWARARPAVENRLVIVHGADQVGGRVTGCLLQAVARWLSMRGDATSHSEPTLQIEGTPFRNGRFGIHLASTLRLKLQTRLERLMRKPVKWQVGWRTIENGGLWSTRRWPGNVFNWLTDDPGRYYADPFVFQHQGRSFLFVEEFPYATRTGILSVAEMTAEGAGRPVPFLETGSHLSYPFVFERDGAIWMIPETAAAGGIHLYRADGFPMRWSHEAVLVPDLDAGDATLVEANGALWLFATVRREDESSWDGLWLFTSRSLMGPWTPHPMNPVLIDAEQARPAGVMRLIGGEVVRPVQYCVGGYGRGLGFARVKELSTAGPFRQELEDLIVPRERGIYGFHTLNTCGSIEVVDMLARPDLPKAAAG